MPRTKKEEAPLETQLDKIKHSIDKLETQDLTLEDSLMEFELATTLITNCKKTLNTAELKIESLSTNKFKPAGNTDSA